MDLKVYSRFLLIGIWHLLFLILPLLALAWIALDQKIWQNLDINLWLTIKLSLQTSLISCTLVVLFGAPLAFYLAMHKDKVSVKILQLICDAPLTLPPAIAGLSLLLIFSPQYLFGKFLTGLNINIAFTTSAVVLAQIFVISPFFIRSCIVGFSEIDKNILDAALIDGASEWQRFFNLVLPIAKSHIFSGMALCWLRAMGEFGATAVFAGNIPGESQTIALFIYDSLAQNWQSGVALSFLVMIFCWGGLIFMAKITKS